MSASSDMGTSWVFFSLVHIIISYTSGSSLPIPSNTISYTFSNSARPRQLRGIVIVYAISTIQGNRRLES
ncbi:uncharacterized protein N7515_002577 [Penicillium bovifimosum]|uniref:Uncharacterized protein n=1 Tax=Penicillium bovifimosum TaxID=126998 RepID=A0A9W9L877_9EURO|nr:uncharacterized protein N7515_002577 [Penicillium bovifimosum]KAJ5143790.1 hypothetical protein N7515_002577 [Penicillium bovifimosum]